MLACDGVSTRFGGVLVDLAPPSRNGAVSVSVYDQPYKTGEFALLDRTTIGMDELVIRERHQGKAAYHRVHLSDFDRAALGTLSGRINPAKTDKGDWYSPAMVQAVVLPMADLTPWDRPLDVFRLAHAGPADPENANGQRTYQLRFDKRVPSGGFDPNHALGSGKGGRLLAREAGV